MKDIELDKITLRVEEENELLDRFEINVEGLTILVGYNATFKSIIARTFLYCRRDEESKRYMSTLEELGVKYVLEPDPELPCNSLRGYIPDSRIVMRRLLTSYDMISDILKYLDDIVRRIRSAGEFLIGESEIEKIKDDIRRITEQLGLEMIRDIIDFKKRAGTGLLRRAREIYDNTLEEIKNEISERYKENIEVESIAPLEILETVEEKDLPRLSIYDQRFNKEIRYSLVSSSVIAPLLIEYIISFLSTRAKTKILVIEEPEETLTPLQQLLVMRFLSRASKEMDKFTGSKTFVIVTTHSPYIAFAVDANQYFMYYDAIKKKISVSKERPHTPFILADLLLGSGRI